MKMKSIFITAGLCALVLFTGCNKEKTQEGNGDEKGIGNGNTAEAVTLGEYMGIEVPMEQTEVSEEELKTYIEGMIAMYETVPVTETLDKTLVEDGDEVNINYEGLLDGEAFAGGTAANQVLGIGSGRFIEGFEEGLIGSNVGDTVSLNLTFPDPYNPNPDMSGKPVVFNVKINAIVKTQEMTYENLTDEYVANNFGAMGVETVDALKASVSESLSGSMESAKRTAIITKLEEICTVNEFPQDTLDERVNELVERQKKMSKEQYGLEYGEFLQQYFQMTEEEYVKQITEEMKESLTQETILLAIADKEGVEADEEGYQQFITSQAANYGYDSAEAFEEENGAEYLANIYRCNKAMDLLSENAVVVKAEAGSDAPKSTEG